MFTDVPSRTGKEYVFSPVTRYCHQPTTSILLCLLGPFDSNMSDRLHRIPQTSCMYIEPDHSQHDRSRPVLLYSVPRSQPHAIAEFACVYHTREEVEEEWGWVLRHVPSYYHTESVCVWVHGDLHCRRKEGVSKWTKSGPSGPSSSSYVLFVFPKVGPKTGRKNGAAILPEEGRLPIWRSRLWDQGVAYTVSSE